MKYSIQEIFNTVIILFILRNILILINIIFSIKNIEILFLLFLLILNYFIWVRKNQSKELLDKYILINFILLFFFSINKMSFLLLVSAIQISLIIFAYKIKINFSLKEFLKIFIISGIVYYLPVILLYIFFKIIY